MRMRYRKRKFPSLTRGAGATAVEFIECLRRPGDIAGRKVPSLMRGHVNLPCLRCSLPLNAVAVKYTEVMIGNCRQGAHQEQRHDLTHSCKDQSRYPRRYIGRRAGLSVV